MKNVNQYKVLVVYVFILCCVSCKKFVEVSPGTNLVQSEAVFSNEKTALSAVSGVYSYIRTNFFVFPNGGMSLNGALAADEIYPTATHPLATPFYQNQLVSTNTSVSTYFYNHAYRVIYQANAVIEGVVNSGSLETSLKKQVCGEMLTIRSLMYFYLINLFGDVPLVVTTRYDENALIPRIDINDVYEQIVDDLTEAESLLSSDYPGQGRGRVNKWTAVTLLSRIYLFRKDWAKAEMLASAVLNSGIYGLLGTAGIANVFLKNSNETIFEMPGANDRTPTGDATYYIPTSTTVRPTYALTSQLLNAFETGDARKTNWLSKNTVSGTEYWYPVKYKQSSIAANGVSNEYQVVFRLAELYLIRAEARANLDNLTAARVDLNTIRNRAGLINSNANSKELLLTAIEKEKQTEFFAEWGHRWLDLKRKDKADLVLAPLKGSNWQSTDVLWPIPEMELLYNPNLSQNPGY